MINLNELTIKELENLVSELFDEEKTREILKLSREEIIELIETDEKSIIDTETSEKPKHSPSRKKKSKRVRKECIKYKKIKNKKWQKKTRSNIGAQDTNNRAFINKSTQKYEKLIPQKSIKE